MITSHLENLHALLKYSNGVPQKRPAFFLDVRQQGEGMADVGTHLADLAQWTLFPGPSDFPIAQTSACWREPHATCADARTVHPFDRRIRLAPVPQREGRRRQARRLHQWNLRVLAEGRASRLKVAGSSKHLRGVDSYFASYRGTRALIEL